MTSIVVTGLACGLLVGAVGLSLRSRSRPESRLRHAIQAIAGAATTLFFAASAVVIWQHHREAASTGQDLVAGLIGALQTAPMRLVLMAAAGATPAPSRLRREPEGYAIALCPSVVAAGAALLAWSDPALADISVAPSQAPLLELLYSLALMASYSVGARALADGLADLVSAKPVLRTVPTARAGYMLLTILVGGTALVTLALRGLPWGAAVGEVPPVAAWLAWSAAWLGLPRHRLVRSTLNVAGSGLLFLAAVL